MTGVPGATRLTVAMPNGVILTMDGGDPRVVTAMIAALGGYHVPFDADFRVHQAPIDFRAGINSLATIVEQSMGLSPFQRSVFAFCNRGRSRINSCFTIDPAS